MSKNHNQNRIKFEPFERYADRYDTWFDHERGQKIFPVEVACLRQVSHNPPRPWLEIGVGTGRFAAALGVDKGIDPSKEVLKYAQDRGIHSQSGFAEKLPYASCTCGAIFMVVTVCFLSDPDEAFRECARVLKPNGSLVIGLVPKNSQWGKLYAEEGKQGHPFYAVTTFYTCQEVIGMVGSHRFALRETSSCLFESPEDNLINPAEPRSGIFPDAGFVALRFELQDREKSQN